MDIGVLELRRVVILQAHTRRDVQRVIAFVGGLGVIGVRIKKRHERRRQEKGVHPQFVRHGSPVPWWLIC
ncbi:hypothetical protein D3C76_1720600 [compost metagenome]